MIVPFALDPDALRLGDWRCLGRLAPIWALWGVLIDGTTELEDAADQLPDGDKKRWLSLLDEKRMRRDRQPRAGLTVRQCLERGSIRDLELAGVQLLGLGEESAKRLGIDLTTPPPTHRGQIEVCSLAHLDLAKKFEKIRDEIFVPEKLSTEEVWKRHFEGLAKYARQVVIFDRYAGTDAAGAPSVPTNRDYGTNGLRHFIDWLARDAQHCKSLVIYTAAVPRFRDDAVIEAIRRSCARAQRLSVAVRLIEGDKESKFHDRYVRFDNTVLRIGCGIEVLKGRATNRRAEISRVDKYVHESEPWETEARAAAVLYEVSS